MKLLTGLLLAIVARAAIAAEGDCWSDVSKQVHPEGTTGFYQCAQYTCTNGNWEATGVTDPDCDIFANGCWSPTVHKVIPYGTKGYYKCDQVECKSDKTWQPTGERLPNCPAKSILCWDWTTNETVPVSSTMYFGCNQYLCTEEYDWVQNGERDPSCETNGCFSIITQEVAPYGVKGYWKCEQMECMRDKTWQKTGERLPGCAEGNLLCWDWIKMEGVPVGSIMNYNQYVYKCTVNDWEQTGPSNDTSTGCYSNVTHNYIPYGVNGYFLCDQMECKNDGIWTKTSERLAGCAPGEVKCWNWMQNATVPIGNVMFFQCKQYKCTENDWARTSVRDPTCSGEQCIEGRTWKQDCNSCICRNGQGVCTTRACIPADWPQRGATLPPGAECTEESSFKMECNDCVCTNGRIVCTFMACLTNYQHPSDAVICKEGSLWKTDDCNTCRCRDNKQLCTRRLCRDGAPVPPGTPQTGVMPLGFNAQQQTVGNKAEAEAECQIEEGSSDRWRKDCNWCRCINGKGVCTRRGCSPAINERLENEPECEGTVMYKKDCNWCSCMEGRAICTFRACLPGSFGIPISHSAAPMNAAVHRTRAQPPGGPSKFSDEILCTAGSVWRMKCNQCHCVDGKGVCTEKACPPGPDTSDAPVCEGESSWKIKCNWCNCTDGQAVCQRRVCASSSFGRPTSHSAALPPGGPSKFSNEILCTPGSVWRMKCNQCRCVDGKGVCTKKACPPGQDRSESPVCDGESSWKIKCNWCNCTDGQAVCQRRVCGFRPFIPRDPLESNIEEECTEGSNWRRNCNWCRCVNGKQVCTRRACASEIHGQFDDKPECVGEARWKENCNWCSCQDSKALCTLKACLPARSSPTAIGVITDDEPECSEGSKWMKSCNNCQCRNGKASCSKKACPPPQVLAASDQPECEGNSQWRKDCNLCKCLEGRAVCTLRACAPGRPSTGFSIGGTDADVECDEGARWRKDCNWCSCLRGRGACTKMGCLAMPGNEPAWKSAPDCEGTSRFKKDCNWCSCQNGFAVCTQMACLPTDVRSPSSTSNAECLDGSTWKNECNSCSCMNGHAACTMMACIPNFKPIANEEECSPGAFWKKDCNSCRCVNGKGVCTRRACISVPRSPANAICSLPASAPGAKVCAGFMRKWTYNSEAGECQQIVYGGCGGTENLFNTIEECQNACKSPQGVSQFRSSGKIREICKLPIEAGPCFASKAKFAFNHTSNRCERFFYGGCQGNANKFNSAQECSDECGGEPPVFDADCDRSKCQWSRWSHYTSKGCLPQYDNGACCPTSFTCPSQDTSDPNVCHYRGKDYEIGDEVPIANECEAGCRCSPSFTPGSGADIRCASIECPDLFNPPEPNCRQLYRQGQCCSYKKDCQDADSPPQIGSELFTCKWGNKTYREGDKMYFDGEYNCQKCVCTQDFSGPAGAGCDLISCGFDFRYSSKFQKGCTPIYFENKCCPIDWMCPGDSRVVSQPQAPATRSDNMKCTMGDISLEVGATLKLNDRNCDTKCSCLTPPEFTCVKHRNCDLSKKEQSQPMISVRRGNLDCPPVTCNEGCATLTDLRTGCQFCSCGADVVTCPELSCHESCHRVQDTKSGCPRCECNCPKDPLGNPPCPKDCAIHFVKDQATGCEKCECNPSNPGGPFGNPNLPPRKEVCRINPLTGRAHCPMDCAVIYRISPETGCEECKCDPNSSSSPFPRPVPIPTRPNN